MPSSRQRLWVATLATVLLCGCAEGAEPPGPSVATRPPSQGLEPPAVVSAAASSETSDEPGHGARIVSIAMRTWVYQRPDDQSTKLGYLRAGAVTDRAARAAGTNGCDGGWYRVAPRGYACVGKGASLDLEHPVVKAVVSGPRRGEPLPYRYVISRHPPPHLYFKLASAEAQREAEGKRMVGSMALFGEVERAAFGDPDPIPAFLAHGEPLPKPYGAERPLHYKVHRGRASENSAFGVMATFEWTGRRMGLTTELDLIALDRTRIAPATDVTGVVLEQGGVPAFVAHHGVYLYEMKEGQLIKSAPAPYRSGWELTGRNNGSESGLLETRGGAWLPAQSLRIAKLREDPAGFARDGRKWIDVAIEAQLLVAYEGRRPVYGTLVSSGRGGLSDPEETDATIRGTFMIHAKHIAGTMDGDDTTEDSFDLRDVPYIQYFHEGYALHGAYWHDDFGKYRSHGCINLAPAAAAWLFEWSEPSLPEGWHGVVNLNAGTLVYTHR